MLRKAVDQLSLACLVIGMGQQFADAEVFVAIWSLLMLNPVHIRMFIYICKGS